MSTEAELVAERPLLALGLELVRQKFSFCNDQPNSPGIVSLGLATVEGRTKVRILVETGRQRDRVQAVLQNEISPNKGLEGLIDIGVSGRFFAAQGPTVTSGGRLDFFPEEGSSSSKFLLSGLVSFTENGQTQRGLITAGHVWSGGGVIKRGTVTVGTVDPNLNLLGRTAGMDVALAKISCPATQCSFLPGPSRVVASPSMGLPESIASYLALDGTEVSISLPQATTCVTYTRLGVNRVFDGHIVLSAGPVFDDGHSGSLVFLRPSGTALGILIARSANKEYGCVLPLETALAALETKLGRVTFLG